MCHVFLPIQVRAAIRRGDDVNSRSADGGTGLMYAVREGHQPVVRLLLRRPRVDVNCPDLVMGNTALHYSAGVDNVDSLKLLVAHPTITSLNTSNNMGFTPLMSAVFCGGINCVKELARVPRVALDTRHYRGSTLEEVAREMRHDEVLEVLREAKRWREMRSQLEVMLTRQQERRRRGEGRLEGPLCPVCSVELAPPAHIYRCSSGHIVCQRCRDILTTMHPRWGGVAAPVCPVCRGAITGRDIETERFLRVLRAIFSETQITK